MSRAPARIGREGGLTGGSALTSTHATVLDSHNALIQWRDTPEWKAIDGKDIRRFVWEPRLHLN
jgi:hypothetical protein